MMQLVLISIGAGLASALLFASPIGGTALAFPLFCVTGVPIAIAGFGWTALAAAIASLIGAAMLFLFMSPLSAGAFLLLFGLPIAWCVRLAALSRTTDDGTEWYPYGRLLLHAAIAVAIGLALIGVMIGYDAETLTPRMADALEQWFASHPDLQTTPPTRAEIEPFVRFNLGLLPYTFGAIALIITVLDLWLGALVARKSGRLQRPEEPVWTAALPLEALLGLAAAFALSFTAPPLGDIAAVLTGTLACAVGLVGLAVLHAVTIGNGSRRLLLFATYFLLLVFGFPIFLFVALGLAETFMHLRARRFGGSPPSP